MPGPGGHWQQEAGSTGRYHTLTAGSDCHQPRHRPAAAHLPPATGPAWPGQPALARHHPGRSLGKGWAVRHLSQHDPACQAGKPAAAHIPGKGGRHIR